MLQLLEWFKLDKAPLVNHDVDTGVIKQNETMKRKANIRQTIKEKQLKDGGNLKYMLYCNIKYNILILSMCRSV